MKLRLFRKRFDLQSGYYVKVKHGALYLYNSRDKKYILTFVRSEVFNPFLIEKRYICAYSVDHVVGKGYYIGCCFVSYEVLHKIQNELDYKAIF